MTLLPVAMRLALLLALSLASLPSSAQTVRLGVDFVAGTHSSDLSLGMAVIGLVRTPGAVVGYLAVRPEGTVATEGGTGFVQDSDVLYYGDDGLPVYGGGTCRSVATGEPAPGSCGSSVLSVALDAEVGSRLAVGRGAVLVGAGLRVGAGEGLYGAITGQLASPAYARLEVGTGHVMVGLGFGRF